jgi:hypothetical protein
MLEKTPSLVPEAVSMLSREAVLARICVRPPYYALKNERSFRDVFTAEATAELSQGLALGPMRPGDISRHSAIAGSCAIALRQRDAQRRFYLANRATYQGFFLEAPYGSTVQFSAVVKELEKRQAKAEIHAYVGASLLAILEVDYSILTPVLFERLNAHRRRTTERLGTLKPVGEYPVRWQGQTGIRVIPHLPMSACGGHFDDYPAAPVALLMDQLAQIAERSLGHSSYIARGEVTSANLCWAGDTATFSMTKLHHSNGETHFSGGISGNETEVGTMKLWLRSPHDQANAAFAVRS